MRRHTDLLRSIEPETLIKVRLVTGDFVDGRVHDGEQPEDAIGLVIDEEHEIVEYIPYTSIVTWIW